jgi:hypothetical protein
MQGVERKRATANSAALQRGDAIDCGRELGVDRQVYRRTGALHSADRTKFSASGGAARFLAVLLDFISANSRFAVPDNIAGPYARTREAVNR